MPWLYQWPENLKKRACRYLLQRYLGQYLKEKLTLDQLSVDLYKGTGYINDLNLDVDALNEMAELYNLPFEFVDGYIKQISVSIPWSSLLQKSSFVEVSGLMITIQPRQRSGNASVMNSIWSSMTTSMELAKECLRQQEQDDKDADAARPFEGMESFAQTIDSVLCRTQVRFSDTTLRLEHVPKGSKIGVALEIRVRVIDYFDADGIQSSRANDLEPHRNVHEPAAFTHKTFHWEGVVLYTDEFPSKARTFSKSLGSLESSPEAKVSEPYSTAPDTPEMGLQEPMFSTYVTNYIQEPQPSSNFATQPDPILIAKLSGKHEIRLKLKQCETMPGPNLSLDFSVGAVVVFLSPRQVHILSELLSGMVTPDVEDDSNVVHRYSSFNKPMQASDFERVEQELQKHLSPQIHGHSLQHQQGWSSQSLEDSDDEFLPVVGPGHVMNASTISNASTQLSDGESATSTIEGGTRRFSSPVDGFHPAHHAAGHQGRPKRQSSQGALPMMLDDPLAEATYFKLQVSSVVILILHDDILTQAAAGSGYVAQSSVLQMKSQAEKFFNDLGVFSLGAHTDRDLMSAHKKLSAACNANHLRFIGAPCTVEGNDKTSSILKSFAFTLCFGTAELVECLFDKKAPPNEPEPEYCMLWGPPPDAKAKNTRNSSQFPNASMNHPCFKMKINHWERLQSQSSSRIRNVVPPRTELQLHLAPCVSELDITIVDRITCLLNPLDLCGHAKQASPAQANSKGFIFQAMEDGTTHSGHKMELSITSPQLTLQIRFPVPDLRPFHDMDRAPWWKRMVRNDMLILEMAEARFHTVFDNEETLWTLDAQCKELHCLFQENSSDPPISFLCASPGNGSSANINLDEDDNGLDWPRFCLKVRPPSPNLILEEQEPEDSDDATHISSLDTLVHQLCTSDAAEPSPFSTRKIIYESEHTSRHEFDSEGRKKPDEGSPEGEQMVLPGERSDVAEFIEHSINNSHIAIELNLANVNAVLPNKHFYEVLYNRISTDLLLWEPAAPRSVTKDSASLRQTPASVDWASNIMQDTAYQTFASCKSALRCDSSSDSEDENPSYYSFYEQKQKHKKHQTVVNPSGSLQNKICFTIITKQAAVTLHTPLRDALGKVDPERKGEVRMQLMDATFFAVSKPVGSPTAGYMCLHANHAKVFHRGVLPCSTEPYRVMPTDLSWPKHLNSVLYSSEKGTHTKMSGLVGNGGDSMDMLMLAIKISQDAARNVKTFRVALGICGATLRYYMCPPPESWFSQFLDFFDVVDYPISGYKPPDVITELHLHTWSCAVDYRPVYLPLRVILTMESFSICSNIAAQTSSSVVRVIIEDAYLFLSKKLHAPCVDLKQDYVCVIDLSFFELTLRTSDGQDQKQPKTDLRASNNMFHIRTCVDSCRALQELLCYFASDGDLRDFSSNQDQAYAEDSVPSSILSDASTLTIAEEEHVHNLMAEAMAELGSNSRASSSEKDLPTPPEHQQPDSDIFLFPHETHQPNSLFCPSNGDPPSFVEPTSIDSSESDSEDDFCILENDPGVGIVARSGEPQIKILTTEPIRIVDNHFAVPMGRMDQLKAPEHFPQPVLRYTLREISLVWHLYGGQDFPDESTGKSSSGKKYEAFRKPSDSDADYFSADYPSMDSIALNNYYPDLKNAGVSYSKTSPTEVQWKSSPPPGRSRSSNSLVSVPWQTQGGPGRQHDVLMELQMNKVRFQHDKYPDTAPQAARQILLIHDVEIRDRLASSKINKFLYQYSSANMPRQSHANMVVIKALHVRPDPSLPTQECVLKVSLLPLRLNIDQDSLFFLYSFFGSLTAAQKDDGGCAESSGPASDFTHYSGSPKSGHSSLDSLKSNSAKSSNPHPVPIMTVVGAPSAAAELTTPPPPSESDSQNLLITFEDSVRNSTAALQPTPVEVCESPTISSPIFFRSFSFSPQVPIRLDYHGKWVDMEQGALAGIIIGLGQLNCSELCLKRITYRHGLLGVDRLVSHVLSEWLQDIRQSQIPSLLGGVGPLHSLVQLVQGIRDLVWMPIEQYRKDGRIVRGLQRGASAFTTSTAMAALELTNRLVQAVQCTAETAYDVVSPGPSVRKKGIGGQQRRKRPSQPADIREGMANAYYVVREGLGDTARTLVQVASTEHEHKGISGAVGGVLRQIPSTVVTPIILATEATSNVLGGMRHQLAPDVRREAAEKWRVEN